MAACSSMTAARLARLMSCAISSRSTAAVDSRSSQSMIGKMVSLEKLRAKARVDCARGPSEPSMLIGRPSTKPTALRSAASASTRWASAVKALRAMVSTPVASRRSGSLTATPMVLVPRSSPISDPRAGSSGAASISGRTGAGAGMRRALAWVTGRANARLAGGRTLGSRLTNWRGRAAGLVFRAVR